VKALLRFRRQIERASAEQLQSLKQVYHQIVVAAERTLRGLINTDSRLIPVPVKVAKRRQTYRTQSHD
jgi:hypothetical protein